MPKASIVSTKKKDVPPIAAKCHLCRKPAELIPLRDGPTRAGAYKVCRSCWNTLPASDRFGAAHHRQ